MSILQVSVLAVVATAMSVILKKTNPEFALCLRVTCGIAIFIFISDYILKVTEVINELTNKFDLNNEFFTIIIKIVAVSYICEFASGICVDAGETSNAAKVELAGKVIIITLTIPIILSLADLLLSLI